MRHFWLALTVFGIVSSKFMQAARDGRITAAEGLDILQSIAQAMGVKLEFEIDTPAMSEPVPVAFNAADIPAVPPATGYVY